MSRSYGAALVAALVLGAALTACSSSPEAEPIVHGVARPSLSCALPQTDPGVLDKDAVTVQGVTELLLCPTNYGASKGPFGSGQAVTVSKSDKGFDGLLRALARPDAKQIPCSHPFQPPAYTLARTPEGAFEIRNPLASCGYEDAVRDALMRARGATA